jgi:hypothetical protein
LQVDAEWLFINTSGLVGDLKEVVKDLAPHDSNGAALNDALDVARKAVTKLENFTEDVNAEFFDVVGYLFNVIDSLKTDTN